MRLLPEILLAALTSCTVLGQTYNLSTFAGGVLSVNIPGVSASLGGVGGVAVDSAGNVFVTSRTAPRGIYVLSSLNSVLRLDVQTGTLILVAGNGIPGFSGDNGPAASASLSDPFGVAVDSAGNVYIADTGNNRVRKVSKGVITTVAGNGTLGFNGDNGPAISAQLSAPCGVALDSAGNLYIADAGNSVVRKVSNGVITTVAGGGAEFGDNGLATSAQLNNPEGVAVDSAGNLYIADTGNNRVREVSKGVIFTLAGTGVPGFETGIIGDNGPATNASLSDPFGVAVDSAGNVYIADTYINRVRKVSSGIITTVAGTGFLDESGIIGDNGPATSALLSGPSGVAVDSAGNLYIADGNNAAVRKVSNGVITAVAGGAEGFPGETGMADDGPATSVSLAFPVGVAVDSAGNVYIADTGNNRVGKVSNGVITTVSGNGTAGFSGDNGLATSAQLSAPAGVAIDSAGNLYIADSGNNRVRKVSNGVITTVVGKGTTGFSGDNGPANSAELSDPTAVAVDSENNLFIADYGNNRIRKVTMGVITTIAGGGSSFGDNGPATSAQLSFPRAVAVDFAGNLFIADYGNNRIRKVTMGIIATIAGGGSSLGDNGAPTSTQLSSPAGVAVDFAGNVYIADSGNQRIRKVSTGVITTIAGGGASFPSNGPATSAYFSTPNGLGSGLDGVALDSVGNVYVADSSYNRVWSLAPSSCTYSVTPISLQAPASGGNFNVSIQTAPSCSWAVSGLLSFVAVSGASSGAGSTTIAFVVAPNTSRTTLNATLSIAGSSFTVTQAGYTCTTPPVITSVRSASAYGGYYYFTSGSWLEINGTNLANPANPPREWALNDFDGANAPTALDGVSVSINGKPAYISYLSKGQLNVQAPEDSATGEVAIAVTNCNTISLPFTLTRRALAPGLLAPSASSADGEHYMLATFASDGAFVLGAASGLNGRPAKPGDLIIAYGIGFGDVTPSILPGVIVQQSNTLVNPVTIAFGSTVATLPYSGLAGGFVGLYEFYITVPLGLGDGDYQINVTQNGVPVPQTMYLTVQN